MTSNQSTQTTLKLLGLCETNERLVIDFSEFMNAIYEDMSGINELFSIKSMPTLLIEGTCLFYKGYVFTNTLEPRFMGQVQQKIK